MVSFKYLYFSLREGWLVILEKSLMSSLRPVKSEVTLLGWYVYLICESLTLNRPGFLESSTAGGGRIPPPCVISLFEDQ